MALLSDEYFKDKLIEMERRRQLLNLQMSSADNSSAANPPWFHPAAMVSEVQKKQEKAIANIKPAATEEEQIKAFGGRVGSPEYYRWRASANPYLTYGPRLVGEAFGLQFPDDETWDKMTFVQKLQHTAQSSGMALAKMLVSLPAEVVKAPVRAGLSLYQKAEAVLKGEEDTPEALAQKPDVQLPWLGKVENWWRGYDECRKGGGGELACRSLTFFSALGDVTIASSLKEAIQKSFTPRKVTEVQKIENIKPIEKIYKNEAQSIINKAKDSVSEYYSLPKTVAKEFQGNSSNTFLKFTPVDTAGNIEVSVVRLGKAPEATMGDFGPEIKIKSSIINTTPKSAIAPASESIFLPPQEVLEQMKLELQLAKEAYDLSPAKKLEKYANKKTGELPETVMGGKSTFAKEGDVIAQELGFETSEEARAAYEQLLNAREDIKRLKQEIKKYQIEHEEELLKPPKIFPEEISPEDFAREIALKKEKKVIDITPEENKRIKAEVPSRPIKGMENRLITRTELVNLQKIIQANEIEPAVAKEIFKIFTNKPIGEITHSEYVKIAQALGALKKGLRFAGPEYNPGLIKSFLQVPEHLFRNAEEATGIPFYTKVYVPLQNARLFGEKIMWEGLKQQAREIYGKYANAQYAEERILIKKYIQGDEAVIKSNSSLDAQTKKELIDIAEKMRKMYRETREIFKYKDFGPNYQPSIEDRGGIFVVDNENLPSRYKAFSEYEKRGSGLLQLEDSLALWDIYTKAGVRKLYLDDALQSAYKVYKSLPSGSLMKDNIKAFVQEMLGRPDSLEKFINKMGQNLAVTKGFNTPPDLGRRLFQGMINTIYAGVFGGLPLGKMVRNSLVDLMLVYPRLGPEFWFEALKKIDTPQKLAAEITRVRKLGLLVERGLPFGEELAEQIGLTGKLVNAYQDLTRVATTPYGITDVIFRVKTFLQWEMKWNNAISQYNAGKINWAQVEKMLDFKSFHPIDVKIIREYLMNGKQQEALIHSARLIIDETNFPYRRGAAPRVFYGLSKKTALMFGTWPAYYANTLIRWLNTGQYDKIIRWYAAASLISRTAKETFGWNFDKSIGLAPLNPTVSPVTQFAGEIISAVNALYQQDAEAFNEHKENIIKQILAVGIPVGVQIDDWKDFFRSIENWKKGKRGPNGEEFGVWDKNGKLIYWTNFTDIWNQLWGFATTEQVKDIQLRRNMANLRFDYLQNKKKVIQLILAEKFDEAAEIIKTHKIKLTKKDFEVFQIPLTKRLYESLPIVIKSQLAPAVFKTSE